MVATAEVHDELAIDLARECLYRFLAAALSEPGTATWAPLEDFENLDLARAAADLLRQEAGAHDVNRGFHELPPGDLDLRLILFELLRPVDDLRAAHHQAFGLVSAKECPLYETEYLRNEEPFFRAQQMADVAGFYRAFGLEPSRADRERPDHLRLELEFMALLLAQKRRAREALATDPRAPERVAICADAERAFFRDHLAWWVPAFAWGLRHRARAGCYAALARLLAAFMPLERKRLDVPPPRHALEPVPMERAEVEPDCAGCVAT